MHDHHATLKRYLVKTAIVLLAASADYALAADQHRTAGDDPAQYIGSDKCGDCHAAQYERFKQTTMGKIMFLHPRNELEQKGCESCHGPGRAHADSRGQISVIRFGKKSTQPVEVQNAQCLQCHQRGQRMFWRGSSHEMRGVACVDCHQVMQSNRPEGLGLARNRFQEALGDNQQFVKATQAEVCFQCHQMRRAQLQRSAHMPFREGKITCTDCHNPHGTPNPKLLRTATVNETCYQCHAERRGPFLWEHPPVLENCGNCHEPHGSSNPQLLKVRTPKLCQECHNDGQHRSTAYASVLPSTGNGIATGFNNRVVNRACANCHARIHGSNSPSGNYFTR